jgi:CBS domain-containing protein
MYVKDVMTRSPRACAVGETANEAARIMWEQDCGAVPVVDRTGCVVGMVTDRDICMGAYFQGESLSAIPLTNIMSRMVCTCEASTDLTEAERKMREWQVRRLPVVDEDGVLIGILSLSDVAQGVSRSGGLRQATSDGRELLQTVAVVSEPRHREQPVSR